MAERESKPNTQIDFSNTEIAFAHKTNKELRHTAYLFQLMNKQALSDAGSFMMVAAIKLRLPFVKPLIKKTIFKQFCGGESLLDCQEAIDHLHQNGALTILDYGAESKTSPEELDEVMNETIKAVELAAANNSVPVVSSKITGLIDNDILIKLNDESPLTNREQQDFEALENRLEKIFDRAGELGVGVFIDAEESWMQKPIDALVEKNMEKYNREKVIVYNTYQLYRHDKLAELKADHKKALSKGYILGAKLVRGAYMEKERERAVEMNYPSLIHKDKAAVDRDFDEAIAYCVKHYKTIASCCASHNANSNLLQAKLIDELGIDKTHPHLNFCQLYGMSDNISFNLASQGYNIAKYVPYGPVNEVIPYLVRRAKENTSVKGDASRELNLIKRELKRRGL